MDMDEMRRKAPTSFLTLGVIFLLVGFVQQGFAIDFTSGLFSLGFIFALSGLVTSLAKPRS